MDSDSAGGSNPFADSALPTEAPLDSEGGATLQVGRTASLTLGTDSLIVLDEDFVRRTTSNCCGLVPSRNKTTQAIPFFNILWAELSDFDITIQYAKPVSKRHIRVRSINYLFDKPHQSYARTWIQKLLDRAYGESQRKKRIKLLINPFGGKGYAQNMFLQDIEPVFAAARCEVDVEKTAYRGHAVEIAEKLDIDAYDVVASCSGDGLPHEVFNGLGKKANAAAALSKIAVVQLPCGTGNALSWNLNGTDSTGIAALCIVKGLRTPLDLVSITQGQTRTLSFLSQAFGIVADVDLGTDNIRWMGSARFTYGFFVRLMRKTIWPCEVAVKIDIPTKAQIKEHYRKYIADGTSLDNRRSDIRRDSDLTAESHTTAPMDGLPHLEYGTVNSPLPDSFTPLPGDKMGNFYAGNLALMAPDAEFFPAALPTDGLLDLICVEGDIGRMAAIKMFMSVGGGKFFDTPILSYRKISAYRISPKKAPGQEGYISIDGERFPFEEFQAETHKGLGTVLSRNGRLFEARGVVPMASGPSSA